jgi:hypothetical protein
MKHRGRALARRYGRTRRQPDLAAIERASPEEKNQLVSLALGRIFRMGARPSQPGDVEEYEKCRAIIMAALPAKAPEWQPNYARDRRRGAAGD